MSEKKLRIFLQNQPQFNKECEVIYLMVEIRKILDIEKNNLYQKLRFYCNWALHVNLDNKNTTQFISDMFDQDIDCSKSVKEIARKMKSNHADFFKLNDFKNELWKFFEGHNLPLSLIDKNKYWINLIMLLLGIIEECRIICIKSSIKIDRMELTKNKKGDYCYKFNLINLRDKPVIKLKLK